MNSSYMTKAISDFFSPKMLALAILPLLIGIFVWGALFIEIGGWLYDLVSAPLLGLVEGDESGFLKSVINVLVSIFVYLLIFVFFLLSVVITNALVASFYAPIIAGYVQKKHYNNIAIEGFGSIGDLVGFFVKTLGLFLLLLIIAIPLYFIPVVGFLVPALIFFWFFKKNMVFDVGSTILNKEEYQAITYDARNAINGVSIVAYLSGYIPIFNFFAAIFQVLAYTHLFFDLKRKRITGVQN